MSDAPHHHHGDAEPRDQLFFHPIYSGARIQRSHDMSERMLVIWKAVGDVKDPPSRLCKTVTLPSTPPQNLYVAHIRSTDNTQTAYVLLNNSQRPTTDDGGSECLEYGDIIIGVDDERWGWWSSGPRLDMLEGHTNSLAGRTILIARLPMEIACIPAVFSE